MSMFIGKQIEITSVNPVVRSISMIIHIYCDEENLFIAQQRIPLLANVAIVYLSREGFLDDQHDIPWFIHVAGFAHPQTA